MKSLFLFVALFLSSASAAENRFNFHTVAYTVTANPTVTNWTGLETGSLVDGFDHHTIMTEEFMMRDCHFGGSFLEGMYPKQEDFKWMSPEAFAELKESASFDAFPNMYPGAGSNLMFRALECYPDDHEMMLIKLRSPYQYEKNSVIDLKAYWAPQFADYKIDHIEAEIAQMGRKLYVLATITADKKDEAGDEVSAFGRRLLEISFEKKEVEVKDISKMLSSVMWLDLYEPSHEELTEIFALRVVGGNLLITVGRYHPHPSESLLNLIKLNPATEKAVKTDFKKPIDDFSFVDQRFVVSAGLNADLGGGVSTYSAHLIFDLENMKEISEPFALTIDQGCHLPPVNGYAANYLADRRASSVRDLGEELLVFSTYSLSCKVSDKDVLRRKVKATLFNKKNLSTRTILEENMGEDVPLPPLPEADYSAHYIVSNLFNFEKGDGRLAFLSHAYLAVNYEKPPVYAADVEYSFDPATKTFTRQVFSKRSLRF